MALAEAATFIIRKTVIEILKRGWRDKFKDKDAERAFLAVEYGLDKNQGRRRLRELEGISESSHETGRLVSRMSPRSMKGVQEYLTAVWAIKPPSHAVMKLYRGQSEAKPLLPKALQVSE